MVASQRSRGQACAMSGAAAAVELLVLISGGGSACRASRPARMPCSLRGHQAAALAYHANIIGALAPARSAAAPAYAPGGFKCVRVMGRARGCQGGRAGAVGTTARRPRRRGAAGCEHRWWHISGSVEVTLHARLRAPESSRRPPPQHAQRDMRSGAPDRLLNILPSLYTRTHAHIHAAGVNLLSAAHPDYTALLSALLCPGRGAARSAVALVALCFPSWGCQRSGCPLAWETPKPSCR